MLDLLLIYTEITYSYKLYYLYLNKLAEMDILTLLAYLFYHYLSGFGYVVFFLGISHFFSIFNSIASTLIFIFYIQMKQLYRYIASIKNKISNRQFRIYRIKFVNAMILLQGINNACGPMFLAFLIAAIPLNATFINWFIRGQVKFVSKIFIGFFTVYQYNIFILIHFCLTKCSRVIHAPSKILYQFMVGKGKVKTKTRIRLSNEIFLIHSNNRFGFKYSNSLGLITINTFAKVNMLFQFRL